VALSHISIKGKLSVNAKNILQIVRTNEGEEFINYFPEFQDLYNLIKSGYDQLVEKIEKYLKGEIEVSDRLSSFINRSRDEINNDIKLFLKNFENIDLILTLMNVNFDD